MALVVQRFDVYLVNLDPTVGAEIQKTRPCVVVSPDQMNRHIATVIIAPMATQGINYPTRVACQFDGKDGLIVLDRLRTVDRSRLVKRLGRLSQGEQEAVLSILAEMFAP
jgi:mRNA interferase MazF